MPLLEEYSPPNYVFDSVELDLLLPDAVLYSRIHVSSAIEDGLPLLLDGRDLKLLYLRVEGQDIQPTYEAGVDTPRLIIAHPPKCPFVLEIGTQIMDVSSREEGLYHSKQHGYFVTQCEPCSFSKLTYYQDRPDVLARFTVRVTVQAGSNYPVILSNGNLVEHSGMSWTWRDPFPKPCYIFALLAGSFVSRESTFVTASGRSVQLRLWCLEQELGKTEYVLRVLESVMRWEEEAFGLEYDLEVLNVACVPDTNYSASENKGLIIFHSRFLLASQWCSTDADLDFISGLIAHEYLHNWTGNRVTIRDWFQLSLKEGLTDFREQEFTSSLPGNSAGVQRITFASELRRVQFPEDSGPLAHPVRPSSYVEVDNLYTGTVYKKGAEVARMYQTLLGRNGFRKGMDLYISRHDGEAVTCEDFNKAMCDANSDDLPGFMLWYTRAGTPTVTVKGVSYEQATKCFTMRIGHDSAPMLVPFAVGLLDRQGVDLLTRESKVAVDGREPHFHGESTVVLRLTGEEHEVVFYGICEPPVLSLLRGFSAPVKLAAPAGGDDWDAALFLFANDSDEFNSWDAGQQVVRHLVKELASAGSSGSWEPGVRLLLQRYIAAVRAILAADRKLNKSFVSMAVSIPSVEEMLETIEGAEPEALHWAREAIKREVALELKQELINTVVENRDVEGGEFRTEDKGRRALKNAALGYLAALGYEDTKSLAMSEYQNAANITDLLGALEALMLQSGEQEKEAILDGFYQRWQHDSTVVNKWLRLQAATNVPGNLKHVRKMIKHPCFDLEDTTRVSALLGGFLSSPVNLHAADGSGYDFMVEIVELVDPVHPKWMSRCLATALTVVHRLGKVQQELAKERLRRIASNAAVSKVVVDRVSTFIVNAT